MSGTSDLAGLPEQDWPRSNAGWISRWQGLPVPVLRRSHDALLACRRKIDSVTPAELSAIAQFDPLLAFNVLRHVNGRKRSSFAADVMTLEAAVHLLGTRRFVEQFLLCPVLESRLAAGSNAHRIVLENILLARHGAYQARELAVRRLDIKPDEVGTGVLLHNATAVLFGVFEPAAAALWAPWQSPRILADIDIQLAMLGTPLASLHAELMRTWHFPEPLLDLTDPLLVNNPRTRSAMTGVDIACSCRAGWLSPEVTTALASVAEVLQIEVDEAAAFVKRNALVFARSWPFPAVPSPATWIPMLPGPWPAPREVPVESPIPAPAAKSRPSYQEVVAATRAQLDHIHTFNHLMSLIIKGMKEGLGLNRVLFALLVNGQQRIKARYVVGASPTEPLGQFNFGLEEPHLLTRLLQKPAGVWLNETTAAQFEPILPRGMRDCIGEGGFFAMSIFVKGQAVGMLYADRRGGDDQLDEASYQAFKQLALLAAAGLENCSKSG